MKIIPVTVYTFDELSERAKARAISDRRETNLEGWDWWDYIYEDARSIAAGIGIEIEKIYFSGFGSQGDGACFEGTYVYKRPCCYAGKDEDINSIISRLDDVQQRHFYQLTADIRHIRSRYYHENSVSIDVNINKEWNLPITRLTQLDVESALRDFMRWIYKRLRVEYDYLQSDEAITQHIIENEDDFLIDGTNAVTVTAN
jgi:hypothetical protein